jgi:D-glycero-alpha-D-manno-heptose-7-phosphate kinase
MIKNLDEVKGLGVEFCKLLKEQRFAEYGRLMREHWTLKKARSPAMTNQNIDDIYDYGIANGANGGKLVGAGGGGFILFQSDENNRLRGRLLEKGLKVVDFSISPHGAEVIRI